MTEFPYLTGLWLFPALAGAAVLLLGGLAGPRSRAPRVLAMVSAAAMLAYAFALLGPYHADCDRWRLLEIADPSKLGIGYALGVDGLGLSLVWLNAFLTAVALAASWSGEFPAGYWAAFLFLEAAVMGVFLSRDLFYFFLFWEASLLPMFFIIGLWGGAARRQAALKFLLYTVFGSMFMLVGFLALVTLNRQATGYWTWDIAELAPARVSPAAAPWIFAAIALGFAVKVPMVPLHSWLPDAHTEAPAAGSVMLAGILLKLGVFGFLRIVVPLFPELSRALVPWIGAWGVVNVLYGALCAMAQTDLKRLVAYTSISHLGFCMIGLFSLTEAGLAGASLQLVNHGLSTGALFILVGMLYDRAHRRGVADFGGLAVRAPWFAFFFGFVMLSSIGLPGLNGFVGEALTLIGMASAHPALGAAGALGALLAAGYFLPAYQSVFWAPAGAGSASEHVADMRVGERCLLWLLSGLILILGLYPAPLLRLLEPALSGLAR